MQSPLQKLDFLFGFGGGWGWGRGVFRFVVVVVVVWVCLFVVGFFCTVKSPTF